MVIASWRKRQFWINFARPVNTKYPKAQPRNKMLVTTALLEGDTISAAVGQINPICQLLLLLIYFMDNRRLSIP